MAQTIKLKRSSVQNNVPSTSDLDLGELAINTYDGKLFIKKNDGSASIVQVGGIVGSSELTDGSVTTTKIANNAVTTAKLADNSVGITQLNVSDGSNGQVLTTNGSGTLSFSTVSSGASNQNAFSNVAVSGQSTLAADATTDTLNLVAGSGITITTNAGTDSVTINSTATGSVTEAFKTIAVSGQSNVVADGATDTLTLVGGTNMTITTNASNDTITFASSGGGTGTTGGIDSQVFNGDGTDTTFTLTTAPSTENNLWVFVDGVYQNKDSYSVNGTTLTMADAPDNGTKLAVHHVRVGVPANNSITAAQLASPLSLTGDFAVDTNVLKVDSTNNRVGINITAPSEALDVVGNMGLAGELKLVTAIRHANSGAQVIDNDDNTYLKLNDPEGAGRLWLGDSGDATNIYRNTTHKFVNADVSTEYMRINSTGVGIGTTSPARPLHIASTSAMRVPIGTTAQRPTGAVGDFRYNSNDGKFEGYTAAGWGAIAGSGGGSSSTFLVQELTGNGSTTAFTLEKTVTSEDNLIVFNEGVFQRQDSYAAANTTITFDTAPANGNKLVVYQMETGVVGVAPKIDTMTGDGSDTTLTLSVAPASENQTIVNIDGVTQHKATYSVSGTTLTFSSPPPSGSAVECITLTNMSVTTIGDDDLDTKIHFDETADDDVIRFDTAGTERMVIGGTGNIGIGTASPAAKLHVNGEAYFNAGTRHYTYDDQGNYWSLYTNTDDSFRFNYNGSGADEVVIDTSGNTTFNNNVTVTGNFTVNGTTTTLNSTSLTIDDKKITVAEGAGSSAGANESGIEIGVGATGASSNPSLLYYNSGTKFVINKPLDITGNSTATNQIATTSVYSNNGVYYGASTLDLKDSTAASFLSFASNKNATFAGTAQATRVGIGVAPHATAGLNITSTNQNIRLNNGSELAIIDLESGGALNIWSHGDNSNNEIKFYQGTGSGAEKMRIHGNGKVGLKQVSPNADLHIGDSAIEGSATNPALQIGGANTYRLGMYTTAEAGVIDNANGDDGLIFHTKNAGEAMRIDSNGKVRIGATLGLNHLLNIQTASSSGLAQMEFRNTAAGTQIGMPANTNALSFFTGDAERVRIGSGGAIDIANNQLGWYSNTDSAWMDGTMRFSNLNFKNAGGTTRMYIAGSTGKVGIGLGSGAVSRLHVRGTASNTMTTANAFAAFDGVGGDGVIIGARASSPFEAYIQAGYTPNIGTSHHYPLVLNPHGGNVGIHTTAPSHPLHVAGDALITTTEETELTISGGGANYHNGAIVFKATNSTSVRGLGIYMHDAGGDHEWYAGTPYGASDQYQIGRKATASHSVDTNEVANAFVTVKNDGDVGIGTTTPGTKLDVNGSLQASTIKNVGTYNKITAHTSERYLVVGFPNGVANQKIKIILANTYWGELEVSLTGTYSNQNMSGVLTKKFGTGLNANTAYTNASRITESLGATADNFHIGDVEWDSSLSKWVIVVTHRVSSGNSLGIRLKAFAQSGSDATDMDGFYTSSVYTTDSTSYGQQVRVPAFHAYLTSSVSLSSNAIVFGTKLFDKGGDYNSSNGRFTAPQTGVYSFTLNALMYPHTTGILNPRIMLNGSNYGYVVQQGHANASHTAVVRTFLVDMTKGQYVQVKIEGSGVNGSCNIYGGQTYFTGHLVG